MTIPMPSLSFAPARRETPVITSVARLYVVNIPYDATERTLEAVFEKFGTVVNVTVPVNRETGKSRGFAFIEYEKADEARKALLRSGKIALGGRALYLQKADATSRRSYGKAR
jgi:cold-inducible RNA-binding protein